MKENFEGGRPSIVSGAWMLSPQSLHLPQTLALGVLHLPNIRLSHMPMRSYSGGVDCKKVGTRRDASALLGSLRSAIGRRRLLRRPLTDVPA